MRPSLRTALVLTLLVGLSRAAPAAPSVGALDSLTRYVDGLEAFGFTSQVVVAEGDSLLLTRAMGRADGKSRPVGPTTAFAVGSITKSVTAALIIRLVSESRSSLDDPLGRLLPDVPARVVRARASSQRNYNSYGRASASTLWYSVGLLLLRRKRRTSPWDAFRKRSRGGFVLPTLPEGEPRSFPQLPRSESAAAPSTSLPY